MKGLRESPLIKVIRRESSRITKSPVLLFTSLAAPIISIFLITWIFSAGVVRNLSVAVVNNDHSALSRSIVRNVDATPIAKISNYSDLYQAHQAMNMGNADAIIHIPNDLEKQVLKGASPEIVIYLNNANVVKGGLIYSGVYKALSTIRGAIKLNTRLKQGLNYTQALQYIQPVKIDSHLLFNPFGNYSYFLTLGVLPLMITILSFLVSAYAVGTELKYGSAKEWLTISDNSVLVALTGKLMPYTFLFFISTMLMNLVLFKYLGTPLKGNLLVLLFSEILLIITYQLLAVLFISVTANLRLTLSLGSAYTMMAMTFAGVTFPIAGMPLLAKLFSYFFPYTFWIRIFISQSIRNQPFYSTIPYFIAMLIFIIAALLSFPLLKRKMTDSKYWGRA